MNYIEVMTLLESLGSEQTRKIYRRHGCDIDQFGVSVANLKKVYKQIKNDSELGYQLLMSNNADAMYLSQWMVDSSTLTIDDIESRILSNHYYMIIENTIPNIIIQNQSLTQQCLNKWIRHDEPRFRQAAYSVYSLMVAYYDDSKLDIIDINNQLEHISLNIHQEANRVRYTMNNFVISVGTYCIELSQKAKTVAKQIGAVDVNVGETSCVVPLAYEYIEKVERMNRVGKKRKR